MSDRIEIRPRQSDDQDWIVEILTAWWGSPMIGTLGQLHDAAGLPAWVAVFAGRRAGLLTYRATGRECEIVSLNSLLETRGVGSALLRTAEQEARRLGCGRISLVTSNDNLAALGFYQKRGYRLRAIHPGAIDETRRLKPEIPQIGRGGIPLHDEIELALQLNDSSENSCGP